jgi:hypothetical protein
VRLLDRDVLAGLRLPEFRELGVVIRVELARRVVRDVQQRIARRVRGRYIRRLDDLPCLGRRVRLRVAVRRFVCPKSDCPRRIFTERLPGFAAPWARTTDRLRQTQTDIGSSLGGEAGSRLASRMGMATSPDTLLRRVKRLKNEPPEPPRVVGIDDRASVGQSANRADDKSTARNISSSRVRVVATATAERVAG